MNFKNLYIGLKQQEKLLLQKLNPEEQVLEKVGEVPENFNQVGWDITVEKVETMLQKLKHLNEVKGNKLTPQFYRSIFNRAMIAINEADKLIEKLAIENAEIDFEAECTRLNGVIFNLQSQIQKQQ